MKAAKFLLCLVVLLASALPASAADPKKVLEFDTMVGVSGSFKGTANPINGVNGGGLASPAGDGGREWSAAQRERIVELEHGRPREPDA